MWGYRSERLQRGEIKKGRPLIKSIWVPDDTVVAGKPVHEWARYCLVELAAKSASLDELRDFCNEHGIPAPRQQYWGSTTWNSLLNPHCLLEYAGYGVWNVRGKNQRHNPPSEWVIVPNAHQALITEDEAKVILDKRRNKSYRRFDKESNRSRSSSYLLSGGMFVCRRCGSNMVGFMKTRDSHYYICNSVPNRRSLGCGPGVYVPKEDIEQVVISGLRNLLGIRADSKGLIRDVNDELHQIWQKSHGFDPGTAHSLAQVEAKLGNLRRAVEDGIMDTTWVNQRMHELTAERDRLLAMQSAMKEPPRIDIEVASAYKKEADRILVGGSPAEQKQVLRSWVDQIKLAPENLEVEILYQIPEPVVVNMGAGDCSVAMHQ